MVKIVCFGDSLTELSGYPEKLQSMLQTQKPEMHWDVKNCGSCGCNFPSCLPEYGGSLGYKFQAAGYGIDVVIFMLGSNEAPKQSIGFDEEAFHWKMTKVVQLVVEKAGNARVILVAPPPVAEWHEFYSADVINTILPDLIKRIAKEQGLSCVDCNTPLLGKESEILSDGIHLTPEGGNDVASIILPHVLDCFSPGWLYQHPVNIARPVQKTIIQSEPTLPQDRSVASAPALSLLSSPAQKLQESTIPQNSYNPVALAPAPAPDPSQLNQQTTISPHDSNNAPANALGMPSPEKPQAPISLQESNVSLVRALELALSFKPQAPLSPQENVFSPVRALEPSSSFKPQDPMRSQENIFPPVRALEPSLSWKSPTPARLQASANPKENDVPQPPTNPQMQKRAQQDTSAAEASFYRTLALSLSSSQNPQKPASQREKTQSFGPAPSSLSRSQDQPVASEEQSDEESVAEESESEYDGECRISSECVSM
mmetsp:Transcript_23073/g.36138  ORF Transcript_23073/g.36138 Transcript_23073/m.36138 type:complete len:485 (-) Transcript_23073:257-1711(-)